MIFTHASLLGILGPLVLAPLVIHLLNRRFPHWRLFSSIALIKKSMAQRSRLMRWRHWLLTLLRMLAVAACVAAFLGPIIARQDLPPPQAGHRRVIIVIDHSYSMEAPDGVLTLRGRAVAEASRILDSLGAEDELNVLAASRSITSSSTGWSTNHTAARAFIGALGTGYERADFHKAVEAVAAQVQEHSKDPAEVYLISDFQRTNWADAAFAALPKNTRLFFVNVSGQGGTLRENRAITDVDSGGAAILSGGEVALQVQVANYSASPMDEPIEAVIDGHTSFEGRVAASPWSVQRVPLTIRAPGPGWHEVDVRLKKADSMPLDDVYHLALQVREQEEVVLASDDQGPGLTLRFLEAAVNPYADGRGSLQPRRIAAQALRPVDLGGTSKVVLTRVNKLDAQQARALADFLKSGGGVLYFLDGPADNENLSALAEWFSQPEAVPLRLNTHLEGEKTGGEPAQIAKASFDSRFLRLFRGTSRDLLAQLTFYERWSARAQDHASVLMSYADGTPAMAQGSPGLGNLVLCNFSVAEIASNIARQRVFPAWIQELVAQLSIERMAASHHEPGDLMQADIWAADTGDFIGPSGQPVAALRAGGGERVTAMVPAHEPGYYVLRDAKKRPSYLLAANISPAETDLRTLDAETTPRQAREDSVASALAIGPGENYADLAKGRPVFHWFILAALALLLVESLVQFRVRRVAAQ